MAFFMLLLNERDTSSEYEIFDNIFEHFFNGLWHLLFVDLTVASGVDQ